MAESNIIAGCSICEIEHRKTSHCSLEEGIFYSSRQSPRDLLYRQNAMTSMG